MLLCRQAAPNFCSVNKQTQFYDVPYIKLLLSLLIYITILDCLHPNRKSKARFAHR